MLINPELMHNCKVFWINLQLTIGFGWQYLFFLASTHKNDINFNFISKLKANFSLIPLLLFFHEAVLLQSTLEL